MAPAAWAWAQLGAGEESSQFLSVRNGATEKWLLVWSCKPVLGGAGARGFPQRALLGWGPGLHCPGVLGWVSQTVLFSPCEPSPLSFLGIVFVGT